MLLNVADMTKWLECQISETVHYTAGTDSQVGWGTWLHNWLPWNKYWWTWNGSDSGVRGCEEHFWPISWKDNVRGCKEGFWLLSWCDNGSLLSIALDRVAGFDEGLSEGGRYHHVDNEVDDAVGDDQEVWHNGENDEPVLIQNFKIASCECCDVELKSIDGSFEEVAGEEDDDDENENEGKVELLLQRTSSTSLFKASQDAATVPLLKD